VEVVSVEGILSTRLVVVFVCALAPAALAAEPAVQASGSAVVLLDGWRFQPGDDSAWAQPAFDDSSWAAVRVPLGWGAEHYPGAQQEFSWFRVTVALPAGAAPHGFGVTLGKVDSAYELFAGGARVGGVGALPPLGRIEYDRHRTYRLPTSAFGADGRLVLAVRVWTAPNAGTGKGGLVEGPFRFGPVEELERQELLARLPELLLTALFLTVGLSNLLVFLDRPQLRAYVRFGVLALNAAGYSFLLGQWKYALFPDGFAWMKELEYAFLYAFAASFIQFAWPLLNEPIGPLVRGYQWLSLAAAVVAPLTPGLFWNNRILPVWEAGFVAATPFLLTLLAREIRRGNREARALGLGLVVFMAAYLHDVLLDRGFITTPRMTPYGFAALVVAMALSLSQRFTRLFGEVEALSRDLELRVRERTQELSLANERLAEQAGQLRRANEAKSRFLLKMSHEVRTPLNGVLGMARLLMSMRLGPEAQECARDIHRSGNALLTIVNDVLDFVRVDGRKVGLHEVDFEPGALVLEAVSAVRGAAEAKGLQLSAHVDEAVPARVRGDAGRLRQVLDNLIDNAVKFTARGKVSVSAQRESERLRFSVQDTGIGVAPELQATLFEPFAQADESLGRRHGGTGLGLALARGLAALMGGDVGVASRPGEGSTFWVSVPLRAVDAKPASSEPPAEASLDALQVARDDGRAGELLVVEDNVVNQRVTVMILQRLGYRADVAASGALAVEAAARKAYDAILMDLQMPEMDGFEATSRIRQGGPSSAAPIIALTASVSREDRDRCIEAGMNDHLGKPATPEQIEETLARWVRGPRRHDPGAARAAGADESL
jgi:signal transduction histidine kinase/CheY-like chemotaxis protein